MGIFTIGKLGRIGMVSALVAVFFLTPRSLAPYTLTLAILLEVAGLYLKSIWAESEPN